MKDKPFNPRPRQFKMDFHEACLVVRSLGMELVRCRKLTDPYMVEQTKQFEELFNRLHEDVYNGRWKG